MKHLKLFLNNDKYIIKLICLAIVCFLIYSRSFPGNDQLFQYGATFNFLNGFGFNTQYFDGENIYLTPVDQWPIFYQYFSLPFIFLTKNPVFTFMITSLFSKIFLSIVIYKLYKILFGNKYNFAFNGFIIIITISLAPIGYGTDIDIITSSSLIFSLIILHHYYFYGKKITYLILFFLILGIICHMRYAYIPIVTIFLVVILIYEILNKNLKNHLLIKIILALLSFVNVLFLFMGPYFQKTSLEKLSSSISKTENLNSYWHLLYAPLVNSFFPDFIVFNFMSRSFGRLTNDYYLVFVIVMMIFSILIFYFLIKGFLLYYKREKLTSISFITLFLLVLISINIFVMFIVYGPYGVYTKEQISNTYKISYEGLAIVNRYLVLLHISVFTLAIVYAVVWKKNFFRKLLFLSFLFGIFHFIYLLTVYSVKRTENLKLLTKPESILIDCNEINKILISNNQENILFYPVYINDSIIHRQTQPLDIAMGNGVTIFKSNNENNLKLLHKKMSINDFSKVFYCHYTKNADFYQENLYKIRYKGHVFTLYEKK